MKAEALETYLARQYRKATAKRYGRDIALYLQALGEAKALQATYGQVVAYLGRLRTQGKSSADLATILQGIKKYYYWLLESGQRKDHPCAELILKDKPQKEVRFTELLSREELESLLERKERYGLLSKRNQIILTLLIYQALTVGDLVALQRGAVDLAAGTLSIKASSRLNARRLSLRPCQILLLDRYLRQDRPQLLGTRESATLLLNLRGQPIQGEDISYLLETYRKRFRGRKIHARLIRMSVIA
ncbi:MAG: site-specific integrase, partial [Bacteroidia bacterium]|nr:site-specific integrase [Bacteroidia bacterium]